MELYIDTGDRLTDDLLRAAMPLWESALSHHAGDGTVLAAGEDTVEALLGRMPEAAVVLVTYRNEGYLTSPLHKRLSETVLYAALPRPVSLPAWEKAVLTLSAGEKKHSVTSVSLQLFPEENLVRLGQKSVRLTDREFRLFSLLYENRGQAVSKSALTAAVWPDGVDGNACEVHMTHLRKKLIPLLGDGAVAGIRGKGYILK